jgi:hypothetical protein
MSLPPIGAVAPATTPVRALAPGTLGPSFGAVLAGHANRASGAAAGGTPERISTVAARGLEAIERAQARLDGLLEAARGGRTFTPQELLALQGEAYRYSQAVELSAKLVEQGAQAVKQALQAQV